MKSRLGLYNIASGSMTMYIDLSYLCIYSILFFYSRSTEWVHMYMYLVLFVVCFQHTL